MKEELLTSVLNALAANYSLVVDVQNQNISTVFLCSLSRLFRWICRSVNMISSVHVTDDRSDCLLTSQLHFCMANKNPVNV